MSEKYLADRFREEVDRLSGGPSKVASFLKVARNTVYNWMEKGNVPADKLEQLQEVGIDAGYVLTGLRTVDFENQLAGLKGVTDRVSRLSEQRQTHIDVMKLGPLRDLAYKARLSDEHINELFDLLESAQNIYGTTNTTGYDIDLLQAGVKLAFSYIDAGNAEDLDSDSKVEFIIHILQNLIEEEYRTASVNEDVSGHSAEVVQFLEHLKAKQAQGGK